MTQSAFNRLYQAARDPDPVTLSVAYGSVLSDLFQNPFWESGATELHRVLWKQGREARIQDSEAFGSPGLYLWGSEKHPLYVGMTTTKFNKRFSRYIWNDRSQCNLAEKYKTTIVSDGINGFPDEIKDWYAKSFRGSKVRLQGAIRFAEEGIDTIWFALFPHGNLEEIRALEKALIPVAAKWNCDNGGRPLLNIQEQ